MIQPDRLQQALATAVNHLLSLRSPDGHWEGHLSSSALATATAVSALCLAGIPEDRERIAAGLDWLCKTQSEDGGWGDTPDSPSNLSTTLLTLSALHLSRAQSDHQRVCARAEAYITQRSGATAGERVAAIRKTYGADRTFAVPILMNCALAGLVPWSEVPDLPFEMAAFPRSLYPVLRLQVVSYALPALIAVGLTVHHHKGSGQFRRFLRSAVTPGVLKTLGRIQPESGGYLEATPLTAFVTMGLVGALSPEHPVLSRCLHFLRTSLREDGGWPIDTHLATWVTSGAVNALAQARPVLPEGALPQEATAALERSREWLAGQQRDTVHPYTGAAPGGWGWSYLSGSVPDADDTSAAVLALAGTAEARGIAEGARWLMDLQNTDGGWPTFCRGWGQLPFDMSCADITAHALRALHAVDPTGKDRRLATCLRRGLSYLVRTQRADGSWVPLWFGSQRTADHSNPVLATSRVLMALTELDPGGEQAQRGLMYLLDAQSEEGGWGAEAGVPATVEETALAVSALAQWPQAAQEALSRGVEQLVAWVEEGSWTSAAPIGLYFASLWYSETLYPVMWTVEALARAGRPLAGRVG
jgi:squalene-hopene/tetraprenyl-beta-curcumene cyclase